VFLKKRSNITSHRETLESRGSIMKPRYEITTTKNVHQDPSFIHKQLQSQTSSSANKVSSVSNNLGKSIDWGRSSQPKKSSFISSSNTVSSLQG